MKAMLDGAVIADAPQDDLISIEGNWYFPPSAVKEGVLVDSPTPYTCVWKGECRYYSVRVGGHDLLNRAWSYPEPYPSAFDKVGRDFSGYVAFWKEVKVVDR
jgi:uncharacterized protein (DUF427 family)